MLLMGLSSAAEVKGWTPRRNSTKPAQTAKANAVSAEDRDSNAAAKENPRTAKDSNDRTASASSRKLKWKPKRIAPPESLPENPEAEPLASAESDKDRSVADGSVKLVAMLKDKEDPFEDPFGDGATEETPKDGAPRLLNSSQGSAADESAMDSLDEPGSEEDEGDTLIAPKSKNKKPFDDSITKELEGALAQAPKAKLEDCPSIKSLKSIHDITNNIAPKSGEFPPECPLDADPYMGRAFPMITYTWKSSGLCHKPLYFEQVQLERYGHSWGPVLQPIVSGAHFFATIPILPYKMGVEPPCECIYALGYYRPGNCAPYHIPPFPISVKGAALQGAATTGLIFAFP